MNSRLFHASAVLIVALLAGGLGSMPLAATHAAEANCVGRHTSEMAREHGGMRAATEHHNDIHGADLGVGEHAAHIREECGR